MSEVTSLTIVKREERGKGPCGRLRAQGFVPGVFYNSKGENISFTVDNLALGKAFEKVRYSKMIELQIEIDGKTEKRNALFKKLVSHPVKRRYDHVDFVGIDLDKEVQVTIPVEVTGRAKGVVLGGKLEVFQERVLVRCLPTIIPDSIVVDITELGIGDKIFVDQLVLPEGVSAVYDRNYVVMSVLAGRGAKAGEEA
ncbi:MAG: 50S ribosomal protein L25 [Deltaproteobacteria bacterium]|nr:50S ribosomal protein L25 [Deltaproteobacteria bacterium]